MQWAIFASQFHTRGVPSPGRPLQELQRATAESGFFPCAAARTLCTVFISFVDIRSGVWWYSVLLCWQRSTAHICLPHAVATAVDQYLLPIGPTAANLQHWVCCWRLMLGQLGWTDGRTDWQTDGRTPYCFIDYAATDRRMDRQMDRHHTIS